MINKSELFISWHMLVKERLDITLQTLDSLQGLYDECLIAVDDDPSQDELFETIRIYPNTFVFRQHLPNGRFDEARQDILDRASKKATYIGWSDADEPLFSPSPREIREYIYNECPPSIIVTLKYLNKAGPCNPGNYFRCRMWDVKEPRRWKDAVHEYPEYIGTRKNIGINKPDIIFHHLQSELTVETALFRIKMMQEDNSKSTDGWRYPRISGEYRGIGMYEESLENAKLGLLSHRLDVQTSSINELMLIGEDLGDKWTVLKDALLNVIEKNYNLRVSPLILEYLALSYYYLRDLESAISFHDKALEYDVDKVHAFIHNNDKFFHPETKI